MTDLSVGEHTMCVQVENFSVSFSDGRVLCYLIHHYHPNLLSDKSVSLLTTQTLECSPRGRVELDCSTSESDSSFDSLPTSLNGNWQLGALTLRLLFYLSTSAYTAFLFKVLVFF